MYIAAVD